MFCQVDNAVLIAPKFAPVIMVSPITRIGTIAIPNLAYSLWWRGSSIFFSVYSIPFLVNKYLTVLHGAHVSREYIVTFFIFSFFEGMNPPFRGRSGEAFPAASYGCYWFGFSSIQGVGGVSYRSGLGLSW